MDSFDADGRLAHMIEVLHKWGQITPENEVDLMIAAQSIGPVGTYMIAALVYLWEGAEFVGRWVVWEQPVEAYTREHGCDSFNVHPDHPRVRLWLGDEGDPYLDLVVGPTVLAGFHAESMQVRPTVLGRVCTPAGRVGGEFVIGIEQGQDPDTIRLTNRAFFMMGIPTILLSEGEIFGGDYEGRVHKWNVDDFIITIASAIAHTRLGKP